MAQTARVSMRETATKLAEHGITAAESYGRSDLAERLGISPRTVEAHLRSIYPKLGVSTRLALAVAYKEREAESAEAPGG